MSTRSCFNLHLQVGIALLICLNQTAIAEDVNEIPNPRSSQKWMVDTTGTISANDVRRIEEFCQSINDTGGSEMGIAVIRTTNGIPIEEFATELFNKWGIGSARENNGLLLLVAKDDRAMWIELGQGIDGEEQIAIAQDIIDKEILPRFKADDYGEGVYAGAFATATQILSCLLYTSPSPRDRQKSRMPSSA